MKTEYGSVDAGASSCVLLYDTFGNSYAGEPTINLFTQPTGNAGFSIKPTNTGRAFWKLDYSGNLNGQGNFFDNASGSYQKTDSIYKYNFSSSQTDSTSNKHGFNINITRGESYSAYVEVYVSPDHPRTGIAPVLSYTPNLTGSFATLTGSYDFSKKGTWQQLKEKIYVPAVGATLGGNAIYYEVSVAAKTSQHPYYGSGSADGFVVGNVQGRTLNLYKGATYVLSQSNSSNINNEIYLSTSASSGGGDNSYSIGYSYFGNKGLDGYGVFTVPYSAPPILYYNSKRAGSSYFGGKINIIGGYNAGNLGNSGNASSTGSSGNTGSTLTSESYAVCFDPTRLELTGANLNGGYILYKNMQFEKNKKMFSGVIHNTKFTSTSRGDSGSFIDLTGGNNNCNLTNAMYDASSYLIFGQRTNLNDGGVIDINLKSNKVKTFSVGDAATQSYDFWFKQTRFSIRRAYLFSRSSAVSGDYLLDNQGYPQLIYIENKRICFNFSSPSGEALAGYSDQVIELNALYNVTITINTYFSPGSKIDVYLNGQKIAITIFTVLQPPQNLLAKTVSPTINNLGNIGNVGNVGFVNNTNFYCISSYDANGESKPSSAISITLDSSKKVPKLSWDTVTQASGYYLYRSANSSFGAYSLLANITNKLITAFTDDNYQTKIGAPKINGSFNFNYNENVTLLSDSSNAKVCFGSYPISSLELNYFEGYIYRIAIYKTKLSASQVNRNYNSFLYKYKSEDPSAISSLIKQRSVIYGKVKE